MRRVKIGRIFRRFWFSTLDVNKPEDDEKSLQLVKEREDKLQIAVNRMSYLSLELEFFDISSFLQIIIMRITEIFFLFRTQPTIGN